MNTPRFRRTPALAVGLVAAIALVATACGSKKKEEAAPATTAAAVETTAAPATTAAAAQTIVEIAAGNPDFSLLVEAVTAAGLVETLSGKGPFTVFAPTNAAFEAALKALNTTKEKLFADKETLTKILTYHVLAGEVMAADVLKAAEAGKGTAEVDTVNGAKLKVTVTGDKVTVGSANVVKTDIEASNGVIHVIDAVLVPPAA